MLQARTKRDAWTHLCDIVAASSHVKVIFDDGEKDHLAKLVAVDGKVPRDGGVEVRFMWKETDDAIILLDKGLRWIKEKIA